MAFILQVRRLFGLLPVVWPDESLFAQSAISLLSQGKLATPLLTGAAVGVAERAYWYPPGYVVLVAAVFAAAGPTLAALRALSVAGGLLTLLLTWVLARKAGTGATAGALAVLLLAIDPVFVRAALVGRPDTLVLGLTLGAISLVPARTPSRAALAGACASLAALTHIFGWAAVALVIGSALLARRNVSWTALGVVVPLLPWALYALQDPAAFLDQMYLNVAIHDIPWSVKVIVETILDQYADPSPAILVAWSIAAIALVVRTRRDGTVGPVLAGFTVASLATLSRQMWHPLYALPFVYVGLASATRSLSVPRPHGDTLRLAAAVALSVVAATVIAVAATDASQISFRGSIAAAADPRAYTDWVSQITSAIPPHSRVLVSGTPDPAFALTRTDLRVVALQSDARSLAYFHDHLETDIDYVVLSGISLPYELDVVRSRATVDRRITVVAGPEDGRCRAWMPCGAFKATIYAVTRRP
ncbi:MAG: hypothetical protein KGJ98_10260 [Chloroflexota bacterium]|nr:hypothetical protein [Chloroflexota bacterium]MDE3102608.1 hypothetical protein [Chloroflexota bacterium]